MYIIHTIYVYINVRYTCTKHRNMAKNSWKKVTRNIDFYEGLRVSYITPREDDPGNYNYWLGIIVSIKGDLIIVRKDDRDETTVLTRSEINYVNPTVTEELKKALELFPVGSRIKDQAFSWEEPTYGTVDRVVLSQHPPKHRHREHINIWYTGDNKKHYLADYGVGTYRRIEVKREEDT